MEVPCTCSTFQGNGSSIVRHIVIVDSTVLTYSHFKGVLATHLGIVG